MRDKAKHPTMHTTSRYGKHDFLVHKKQSSSTVTFPATMFERALCKRSPTTSLLSNHFMVSFMQQL